MEYFIGFTLTWCILVVIALVLISFRKDSRMVAEDMDSCFQNRNLWLFMGTFILMFMVLPLSIPYSLANIFNNKK